MTSTLETPPRPSWTPIPDAFWDGMRRLVEPYVFCRFIVPGKPQPKERRIGAGRGAFTPKATREAEKRVLAAFQEAMPGWQPEPDGTYGVLIEFDTEAGSRADLDNLTKLVWDALNTELWLDDIQVGMALLRLTRGGDPDSRVWVFGMNNNGTPLSKTCACGRPYRSREKMCHDCLRRQKAIAELLADDDAGQAEIDQLKRRVFSYVTARSVGGARPPAVRAIAEHLGVPENRARAVVESLIGSGNFKRLPNRQLTIVKALGA